MSITFAENLEKMIDAGLGGEVIAPNTSVAVGYQMQYNLVSGPVASWNDPEGGLPINLVTEFGPIQAGTGDPSPDNVRPISGRQSVTVTRAGVNVWDEEWEVGGIRPQDGTLINEQRIRSKNLILCVPNTTYYFHDPTNGDNLRVFYYAKDGSYISCTTYIMGAQTTPNNARFMRFITAATYGTIYNHDISINYPATDHDYHPGTVASVELQLGQTVYGGKVDVTTGTMTVTDAVVDLGSLTWGFRDVYGGFFYSDGLTDSVADSSVCICSSYRNAWGGSEFIQNNDCVVFINANGNGGAITGGAPYKHIILIDRRFTDAASLKAALSGVMLCYKLATPLTIQLTPAQLSTLKGTNNVWSDAGDVTVTWKEKLYTEGY